MPDCDQISHRAGAIYYQNYLLGRMMSLQWDRWLAEMPGHRGRREAGDFFRERVFGWAPHSTGMMRSNMQPAKS